MFGRRKSLARLDEAQDIAGLVEAARPRPEERAAAATANAGPDAGVERRTEALRRLAGYMHAAAEIATRKALHDPSQHVRLVALDTLLDLRRLPPDRDMLEAVLPAEDEWRDLAATAIVEHIEGDQTAIRETLTDYVEADVPRDRAFDDRFIERLRDAADGPTRAALAIFGARQLADAPASHPRAWQLAVLDREEATLALVADLDSGGPTPGRLAAIGRLGHGVAVEALAALGGHHRPVVRAEAAQALGALAHPRGMEALLRMTLDDELLVRQAALAAMEAYGSSGMVFNMAMLRGGVADGLLVNGAGSPAEAAGRDRPVFTGTAPAPAAGRRPLGRRFQRALRVLRDG